PAFGRYLCTAAGFWAFRGSPDPRKTSGHVTVPTATSGPPTTTRRVPEGPSSRARARMRAERYLRTYVRIGRPAFSLNCIAEARGPADRDRVHGTPNPARSLSQHRHHGAHRCREDDYDRAHPLLHGEELQDRRGP